MISKSTQKRFNETVWDFYSHNGRHDLPWRRSEADGSFDPYKILVSEVMLQQTQVARVITKFAEFIECFPDIARLANAEQGNVLREWSGLGYNRRARFLHQAAQEIQNNHGGIFPSASSELIALPGIGVNTAGAILAYAFNQPVGFVETNIRTVYFHHFFEDRTDIHDKEILELVMATIDHEHPREWYWALMDYGSSLKKEGINRNSQSKHYSKQSKFIGSKRQIRGHILRLLGTQPRTIVELKQQISDERLMIVINELLQEKLIYKKGRKLSL